MTVEEATGESVSATLEERETTQRETNVTTELDGLEALMAQITQRQMDLACQLKVQSGERPEDEKVLTVVTRDQERRTAQQ